MKCKQCLCDLWPYVSEGTLWWESREHHATPRQRNGSVSGRHSVHPLSSPYSLWTCVLVHHCRLGTHRQKGPVIWTHRVNLEHLHCKIYSRCSVSLFYTSYYQMGVGENIFGLHQCSSMPRVEKIKDPISVDSHRAMSCTIRSIETCVQHDFTKMKKKDKNKT